MFFQCPLPYCSLCVLFVAAMNHVWLNFSLNPAVTPCLIIVFIHLRESHSIRNYEKTRKLKFEQGDTDSVLQRIVPNFTIRKVD